MRSDETRPAARRLEELRVGDEVRIDPVRGALYVIARGGTRLDGPLAILSASTAPEDPDLELRIEDGRAVVRLPDGRPLGDAGLEVVERARGADVELTYEEGSE